MGLFQRDLAKNKRNLLASCNHLGRLMLFTEDFIDSLKDDPVSGTIALCERVTQETQPDTSSSWSSEDYLVLQEAYALLVEVMESKLLSVNINPPQILGKGGREECQNIYSWIMAVKTWCTAEESKLRVASLRNRFRVSLGAGFAYEFSQGDLDRVQDLINQLRGIIAATEHFEREHQQRLLRRLERLQAEMHKKVSDLDRFWGLIGDAGVVVGKLGTDAKPIVDRIREIADIVWQTQSRTEELPSGTKLPQLENKPSSSADET